MPESTESRVRAVFCRVLGVAPAEVELRARIYEDLGADSMAALELVEGMSQEFGIDVPSEAVSELRTVGDAVAYIDRRRAGRGA
jgi:acyl carrier protein